MSDIDIEAIRARNEKRKADVRWYGASMLSARAILNNPPPRASDDIDALLAEVGRLRTLYEPTDEQKANNNRRRQVWEVIAAYWRGRLGSDL